MLDGKVISSPEVQVPCGGNITGSTDMTGDFTLADPATSPP